MRFVWFISLMLGLMACTAEENISLDGSEGEVLSSELSKASNAVPTPPKSLRLEDIDFTAYSQELARFTGLEIGQSRIEAIDTVRLYFAPQEGSNMIQTSQSIFERDDGSVMLYSAAGLPDDSIKAEEIYLILTGENGAQTLQSFGLRLKCYRGENTTDWQNKPCL